MITAKEPTSRQRAANRDDGVRALSVVLREEFGAPFRFFAATGEPIDGDAPEGAPGPLSAGDLAGDDPEVDAAPDGMVRLRLPLTDVNGRELVAVALLTALARGDAAQAQERARLLKWARAVKARLEPPVPPVNRRRTPEGDPAGALAWESLLGIEQLLHAQQIHREPGKNRRRILRAAAGLVKAQALVWAPLKAQTDVLVEGDLALSPWDCGQLASLLSRDPGWRESGYLLGNDPRAGAWAERFPKIHNLIAMPVPEKDPQGWVIAVNKLGGAATAPAPFGRMDVALLSPFAALFGMSLRSYERYQSLKDLLVGLTRSLTSAIDAKDSYTFGHSERVARIAVTLGKELGLRDEELSDIYLAGLLHDIGKIGIRDDVLCKKSPLNEEEFAHIREHPTIGCRILAGLRPISHLLPGVLYHHERYDGKGYPEGLAGEMIPLLARILAVADGYDAMSTTRPYRAALPPDVIEQRLNEGAGTQWDRKVIEAFARCREKVHAIRQRGVGESLRGALDNAIDRNDRGDRSGLR